MKFQLIQNPFLAALAVFISVSPVFAQPVVVSVSCGLSHTLFLKSDGSLWGMGVNYNGQLGLGTNFYELFPQLLVASNVTAIAAGGAHSLFLKTDGSLWGMGANNYGQLGIDSTNNAFQPVKILSGGVASIAAGWYHSLILNSNGSLYAAGYNEYGELGDGTTNNKTEFVQIEPDNVSAVSGGWDYSLFVRTNGGAVDLYGMGDNSAGQLGDGTTNNQIVPERIIHHTNGSSYLAATKVFASLGKHSLIVGQDGSLWGMGANDQGQLGLGNTNPVIVPTMILSNGVTQAATGNGISFFAKADGTLWGMGDETYGALGLGQYPAPYEVVFPVEIWPQPVTAIGAGDAFALFVTTDGTLWGMGYDYYGCLGDGHQYDFVLSPEIIVPGIPPPVVTTSYGNQTVVLYPSYYGNYHTLQISNVGSGVWTTVTNFVGVSGVQLTNLASAAFFKLP